LIKWYFNLKFLETFIKRNRFLHLIAAGVVGVCGALASPVILAADNLTLERRVSVLEHAESQSKNNMVFLDLVLRIIMILVTGRS